MGAMGAVFQEVIKEVQMSEWISGEEPNTQKKRRRAHKMVSRCHSLSKREKREGFAPGLSEEVLSQLGATGILEHSVVESFKEKVKERKMTIERVADMFGVSVSSVNKWMKGQTRRLPVSSRMKMKSFLAEKRGNEAYRLYDNDESCSMVAEGGAAYGLPEPIVRIINQIAKIYEICMNYGKDEVAFCDKIRDVLNLYIRDMIPELVYETMEKSRIPSRESNGAYHAKRRRRCTEDEKRSPSSQVGASNGEDV